MAKMKAPEKGGTPKQIKTKAPPGGDYTPGARAKNKKRIPKRTKARGRG